MNNYSLQAIRELNMFLRFCETINRLGLGNESWRFTVNTIFEHSAFRQYWLQYGEL